MMSYWTYTDIFEELGIGQTPFHGGFGLINTQSLKKPAFHAYSMLSSLGDDEIECHGKSAYVCRRSDEVQVLLWNSVIPRQDAPNVEFFKRPLPSKVIDDATVTLSGFEPDRKYTVTVSTVGYKMGDVYNAYLDMGLTDTPTREQTSALAAASLPKQVSFNAAADENGIVEIVLPQTENQVDLIKIKL